jgi:hypothetical protein
LLAYLISKWLRSSARVQLAAVRVSKYKRKPIMNHGEQQLFDIIREAFPGHLVCPQVALGEVLSASSAGAFYAVNCKRCDVLVVDRQGWPVAAFELQGSGHWLDRTAGDRDSIKREALESAGVAYVEIFGRSRAEMAREVRGNEKTARWAAPGGLKGRVAC